MLCSIIMLIICSVKFYFFKEKHKKMIPIINNADILTQNIPPAATLAEKDLHEIIIQLKKKLEAENTRRRNEQRESLDYYTTWVHQIKTPIASMKMIIDENDTEEFRTLSSELFRIEQYTEMALCYLRLGSESSDYILKGYELDGIIKQAIHRYASQFIRKRISLSYTPVNIKVLTDEKWLLFIIEQLLSNAVKYTNKGGVTISVTPNKILIISDTGIGIASEDLPRIFEKGFTGYNGRTDKKSTGLGLYLCKTAANKLSHKIYAQSEAGKGTSFFLDLNTYNLQTE
ncbi:MAG: sensor histidine kinase [Clostridiales bacterium]|nr:sensor histidine kinase [Clostridiales bacterium]